MSQSDHATHESHDHAHGEGCGHERERVPHGGHLHHPHGGHGGEHGRLDLA